MSYDTGWRKSTHSSPANDACVEVRLTDRAVAVRDSKDPHGGQLAVTHAQWSEFLHTPHD